MNFLKSQQQTSPAWQIETWYKVEAEYLKDCRSHDDFSGALIHFLCLGTQARLIEMIGAGTIGKVIIEKNS